MAIELIDGFGNQGSSKVHREEQVLTALQVSEEWQSASGAERRSMENLVTSRLMSQRSEQRKWQSAVDRQWSIGFNQGFEAKKQQVIDFTVRKWAMDGVPRSESKKELSFRRYSADSETLYEDEEE
jgi:arylamine N-acetyltransferase